MAKLTKEEAEKLLDEIRWIGCEFYPSESVKDIPPITKQQLRYIKTRIDNFTDKEATDEDKKANSK